MVNRVNWNLYLTCKEDININFYKNIFIYNNLESVKEVMTPLNSKYIEFWFSFSCDESKIKKLSDSLKKEYGVEKFSAYEFGEYSFFGKEITWSKID